MDGSKTGIGALICHVSENAVFFVILSVLVIFIDLPSSGQVLYLAGQGYDNAPSDAHYLDIPSCPRCSCFVLTYKAEKKNIEYCSSKKYCRRWEYTFYLTNNKEKDIRLTGSLNIKHPEDPKICEHDGDQLLGWGGHFEFHHVYAKPGLIKTSTYSIHLDTNETTAPNPGPITISSDFGCDLRDDIESVENDTFHLSAFCSPRQWPFDLIITYKSKGIGSLYEAFAHMDMPGTTRAVVSDATVYLKHRMDGPGTRSKEEPFYFDWGGEKTMQYPPVEWTRQFVGQVFMDWDINLDKYVNRHREVFLNEDNIKYTCNDNKVHSKPMFTNYQIEQKASSPCLKGGSINCIVKIEQQADNYGNSGKYWAFVEMPMQTEPMLNSNGLKITFEQKDKSGNWSEKKETSILWNQNPEMIKDKKNELLSSETPLTTDNFRIVGCDIICRTNQETGEDNCKILKFKHWAVAEDLRDGEEKQIAQYMQGQFCSKCNRPMEAFGSPEAFHKHVQFVQGYVYTDNVLINKMIDQVKQNYKKPIAEADDIKRQVDAACDAKDYNKVQQLEKNYIPDTIVPYIDNSAQEQNLIQSNKQGNPSQNNNSNGQQQQSNTVQQQQQQQTQQSLKDKEFQNALEKDQKFKSLLDQGTAAEGGGNLDAAMEYYKEAVDLMPDNANAKALLKEVRDKIKHRNLLKDEEVKHQAHTDKANFYKDQAVKNQEAYTNLAYGIFSGLNTMSDGEKRHYRGHSWHSQFSYGMDWSTVPVIYNSEEYFSYYDGFNNSISENTKNYVGTSSSMGVQLGYEFYPFFSDFFHIGGFGNARLGLNPLYWFGGGATTSSTESSDYVHEASTLDAQLDYGLKYGIGFAQKYIKFIGEYSFSLRSINTVKHSTSDYYNSYSANSSIETFDEGSSTYNIQRIGFGIRFPDYLSDWSCDLMYIFEKPDFWAFKEKGIFNWQPVYRFSFWQHNRFTLKADLSLNYPAAGEMKYNLVPQNKRNNFLFLLSFNVTPDRFGKNYLNKNSYDGYKKGEIIGTFTMNNANIHLAPYSYTQTTGFGGMVLTRINIDKSNKYISKFDMDLKLRFNSLSYSSTNDVSEIASQYIFNPKICYWHVITKYFNIGTSVQSYLYTINDLRRNDFTSRRVNLMKGLYGFGFSVGFPNNQLALAQLTLNWLPINGNTTSLDLQLGYKKIFFGMEYFIMPVSTFQYSPNFSRQYSNLFLDIGARIPW